MLNHTEQTAGPVLSEGAASMLRARMNRRRFLQAAGVSAGAAGTLGLSACGGVFGVDPSTGPAPSGLDVYNFALNLEYLEAQFYSYVTTGQGIAAENLGSNPGAVTGFAAVKFSNPDVQALAMQLAADELAHVRYLRAAMAYHGVTLVSQPVLNLTAMGAPTNDATFLALARALETVGTSAYEGGVQYLTTHIWALNAAAVIHDVEGQHEAALRLACIALGVTSPPVDQYDRPPVFGPTTIFNTSPVTGLNTARNASEVLQIVYAAPGQIGVSSGGFYPQGMTGNVHTT